MARSPTRIGIKVRPHHEDTAIGTHGERLSVLCLGAHSDDIEIGAGGTVLSLIERGALLDVHWCVLSGSGQREKEARGSAADFLKGARRHKSRSCPFRMAFFRSRGKR